MNIFSQHISMVQGNFKEQWGSTALFRIRKNIPAMTSWRIPVHPLVLSKPTDKTASQLGKETYSYVFSTATASLFVFSFS